MSNIQEPNQSSDQVDSDDSLTEMYMPRWSGCSGVFNDTDLLNRKENEETHYRKHVIIGQEWGQPLEPFEYLNKAVQHLNHLSRDSVIELCQADDFAVVKYNLDTGELGIARRDDGAIKTFFRPNDVYYILRKVRSGIWAEPDIIDGFIEDDKTTAFVNDSQNLYFYERLEALALELPPQSHSMILRHAENSELIPSEALLLVSRLGECRYIAYELQRAVLTGEQEQAIFELRKKVTIALASFEAFERFCHKDIVAAVEIGLESAISQQLDLWTKANQIITDSEQLETSLLERQMLGYAILELKTLNIHQRMTSINLTPYELLLRKSDLYLRVSLHNLLAKFGSENFNVTPSKKMLLYT